MFELFVIGSFWFWAMIAAITVILFLCTEYEAGGWATVTVIATLAILNWFCGVPIFRFMWENPLTVVFGVGAYFMMGTLWAVAKWWFYVKDQLWKYHEVKREFIKSNKLEMKYTDTFSNDEWKEKWQEHLRYTRNFEIGPQVSKHKMSIYIWIAYFPFSMTWTLIDDPVRKICRRIYRTISDTLQSISDTIWAKTKDDMTPVKKKPETTV